MNMVWTDADLLEAMRLFESEGMSATQVSRAMGTKSKNTVIGAVHRVRVAYAASVGPEGADAHDGACGRDWILTGLAARGDSSSLSAFFGDQTKAA